jgi:uncharacterized protein (DUF952 family)
LTEPIFHLAEPSDWSASSPIYSPKSVEQEGFVHCSTRDQVLAVATAFFPGRDDLVLLTIDPDQLADGTLVYEDLYDHGDLFPHVYGPLPTAAVVATEPYRAHLESGGGTS